MANLDTRSKRASCVQLLSLFILAPINPDGTISGLDRQHAAHTYSGIAATNVAPPPPPPPPPSAQKGAGRSKQSNRKQNKYLVTIDNENFIVSNEEEATQLIEAAREQASVLAKSQAEQVVNKRIAKARKDDASLNKSRIKLDIPLVNVAQSDVSISDTSSTSILEARLVSAINAAYEEARIAAEIKLRAQDSQDAKILELNNIIALLLLD